MSTKETAELFSSNSRIWDLWDIGIRTKQTRIYFSYPISFEMFFIDDFYTLDLLLAL